MRPQQFPGLGPPWFPPLPTNPKVPPPPPRLSISQSPPIFHVSMSFKIRLLDFLSICVFRSCFNLYLKMLFNFQSKYWFSSLLYISFWKCPSQLEIGKTFNLLFKRILLTRILTCPLNFDLKLSAQCWCLTFLYIYVSNVHLHFNF